MPEKATNTTKSFVNLRAGSTSGLQPKRKNDERVGRAVTAVATPFPNPYLPPNTIYYDSSTIRCRPITVPIPTPSDFKIMLNVQNVKLDTLRISIVGHELKINGEKIKHKHGFVFSALWSKQFSIPYDTDVCSFTAWVSFEKFLTVYAPKLNPIINVAVHVANSSSEPRKKKRKTGHQILPALDVKQKSEFINVNTPLDHVQVSSAIPSKQKTPYVNDQPGPSSAPDKPGPSKKHAKIISKNNWKKIQPNAKQGGNKLKELIKKEWLKSE